MAIGVDTSKWKPRKVKGTPSHIVRNKIAFGLIGISTIFGLVFHFRSSDLMFKKIVDDLYVDPIEEIERKQFVGSGFRTRSGDFIRRKAEDEKRIDQPHI